MSASDWQRVKLVRDRQFGSVRRKAVMLVLALRSDGAWSTWVGQKRIASEADVPRRTLFEVLNDLEDAGLIAREQRYGGVRGRTTDRIVLVREAIERLPAIPATREQASIGVGRHQNEGSTGRNRPIYRQKSTDLSAEAAREGPVNGTTEHAREILQKEDPIARARRLRDAIDDSRLLSQDGINEDVRRRAERNAERYERELAALEGDEGEEPARRPRGVTKAQDDTVESRYLRSIEGGTT